MLTLVVLASRQPAWSNSASAAALTWPAAAVALLAVVALTVGVALLVAVVWWLSPWRPRGEPADPPRVPQRIRLGVRGWAALAVIAAVVIAALAVVVGELGRSEDRPAPPRPAAGAAPTPERTPGSPAHTPGISPAVLLAVGGALGVGLALLAISGRRRSERHALNDSSPRLRSSGSHAVAPRWPADPRLAAFAAYRRAEWLLSAAGVPRDAAEGPREYLARVVAQPGGAELRELTSTYEKARFSPHAVGSPERARAVGAVRRLEARLARNAQPSVGQGGER